jgi:hypothetical protein
MELKNRQTDELKKEAIALHKAIYIVHRYDPGHLLCLNTVLNELKRRGIMMTDREGKKPEFKKTEGGE